MKMGDQNESIELKRIETCSEYSVSTFDRLNLDSLLTIFRHLSLLDLLRLRYQCRSVNDAVCEYLRTSRIKLQLELDADRSRDDLERVINRHHLPDYDPDSDPTNKFTPIRLWLSAINSHLFENQPHFQSENLTRVISPKGLTNQTVDSLIHFLITYMPNLSELALLVTHENYFLNVARLLAPLRKLKVFFIDVVFPWLERYDSSNFPATEIVDAISNLPELESLYYFRNSSCLDHFRPKCEYLNNIDYRLKILLQRLSSGENFLEVMLPRLRVLHWHHSLFPVGMTFDKIEEISVNYLLVDCITRNYFPAVKTLLVESFYESYSQLDDGRLSFVNVKVLKIVSWFDDSQSSFYITSYSMKALNDLPNLEELHCLHTGIYDPNYSGEIVVERNNTILRLYSQCIPKRWEFYLSSSEPTDSVEPVMMTEYTNMCRKYFQRLQLLTTENPPLVQKF